jgi:hypothetical protein
MANRGFRRDPNRELGVEAEESKSQLLQISLALPSQYHRLRTQLLRTLLNRFLETIYTTTFDALGAGTIGNPPVALVPLVGNGLNNYQIPGMVNNNRYQPRLPESECDKVAMSLAEAFKNAIEEQLVEKIMPQSLYDLAMQRVASQTTSKINSGSTRV